MSQSVTRAIANRKLLQMEKLEMMAKRGNTIDLDDDRPKNKKKDLDLLNLYVKELREPKLLEVSQKYQSPEKCYNKTYLSNGHTAIVKSFEQQKDGVQKLFIEDWKRKKPVYDIAFMGESHHLVPEDDNFKVVKNKVALYEPKKP